MGKVDFRRLARQDHDALAQELWMTIDAVKRRTDMQSFLKDIFTPSEVVMLARRIRIAKHLLKGSTILQTCYQLGVGQATVQSVDRWLRMKCQNYRAIFPPLYEAIQKHPHDKDKVVVLGSFPYLRRKYPSHFALFNMLLD